MIANPYKRVQVKTSSPGDLLMLLFDGCVRFLNEAAVAIDAKDRQRAGEKINRAHAILSELVSTLRPDVFPELCENLEAVYMFCMSHLVRANLEQDSQKVSDVVRVLDPIREAFREAVIQTKSEGMSPSAQARTA
mgnify:CR=1 FL=1